MSKEKQIEEKEKQIEKKKKQIEEKKRDCVCLKCYKPYCKSRSIENKHCPTAERR